MKRLTFKEFYAERFFSGDPNGHWAGHSGELQHLVAQRIADAMAAYADYLAERLDRGEK